MAEQGFTHFDKKGSAVMVDVSAKALSPRMALAKGCITVTPQTLAAIRDGAAKKGDVLGAARLAGIMGAKKTAELIPLCHPLIFDTCTVDFEIIEDPSAPRIEAACRVKLSGKTGAEMEALTGVSIALLTIYDMCKAMDRSMIMDGIRLVEKSGGKSGHFSRDSFVEAGVQDHGDRQGNMPER